MLFEMPERWVLVNELTEKMHPAGTGMSLANKI